MKIRRVVPNVASRHHKEARDFYVELLGFKVAMEMGPLTTLVSPSNETAQISLIKGNDGSPEHPRITLTIEVEDVNAVHARAVERGVTIDQPLADEPWGVRRFVVADPNGVVLNIMSHLGKDGQLKKLE